MNEHASFAARSRPKWTLRFCLLLMLVSGAFFAGLSRSRRALEQSQAEINRLQKELDQQRRRAIVATDRLLQQISQRALQQQASAGELTALRRAMREPHRDVLQQRTLLHSNGADRDSGKNSAAPEEERP